MSDIRLYYEAGELFEKILKKRDWRHEIDQHDPQRRRFKKIKAYLVEKYWKRILTAKPYEIIWKNRKRFR